MSLPTDVYQINIPQPDIAFEINDTIHRKLLQRFDLNNSELNKDGKKYFDCFLINKYYTGCSIFVTH